MNTKDLKIMEMALEQNKLLDDNIALAKRVKEYAEVIMLVRGKLLQSMAKDGTICVIKEYLSYDDWCVLIGQTKEVK